MKKLIAYAGLFLLPPLIFLAFVFALPIGHKAQPTSASEDNWLTDWANRQEISIDSSKIAEPLHDFPVLIHLSESSGLNSADVSGIFDTLQVDSDRKKIAVTASDGFTQLYVEISNWDSTSKQADLWVKVPFISEDDDTSLYLYYDNTQEDNDSTVGDTGSIAATRVWESRFRLVQHLEENGNGTQGEFKDSSSNQHNAVGGSGSAEKTPVKTASKAGFGQLFDGGNDYIEIPDSDDFSISLQQGITISCWIRPDVLDFPEAEPSSDPVQGSYVNLFGKSQYGSPNQEEWQFRIYCKTGSDRPNQLSFYVFNLAGGYGAGADATRDTLIPGQWIHLVGVVDENNVYLYKNGILRETVSIAGYTFENGTANVREGHCEDGSLPGYFLGAMDEVRISDITRTPAWICASYASENDSLIRFESSTSH